MNLMTLLVVFSLFCNQGILAMTGTDEKTEQKYFSSPDKENAIRYCNAVSELNTIKINSMRKALRTGLKGHDFLRCYQNFCMQADYNRFEQKKDDSFNAISADTIFKTKAAELYKKYSEDIQKNYAVHSASNMTQHLEYCEKRSEKYVVDLIALRFNCEPAPMFWRIQRSDGTWMVTSDPEVKKRVERSVKEKREREARIAREEEERKKKEEAVRVQEDTRRLPAEREQIEQGSLLVVQYQGEEQEEDAEGDLEGDDLNYYEDVD